MLFRSWHHRLVLTNSKESLVILLTDSIGHQQAKEVAGVLHRDISLGNILIVDDVSKSAYTGFVHDLDYSSMEDAENSGSRCCEGTADGSAVVSTGADATKLKEWTVSPSTFCLIDMGN